MRELNVEDLRRAFRYIPKKARHKKNKFKTACNQIRSAMNRTETYNSTTQ